MQSGRAIQDTEFDRVVMQLGLHNHQEMFFSRTLREWVKKHRNYRYVPESLLDAWGMEVRVEFTPVNERYEVGRSVHFRR